MFYALTKNNKLIHINQSASNESYFCPQCHALLIIKKGIKTKKHFSHIKGQHCSTHHGESSQHRQAKQQIYQKLAEDYEVVIEYRINNQMNFKIADICLPKERYIIEFQQSTIKYEILYDRHNFYINNGYQVI